MVVERRSLNKLIAILDSTSQPLHDVLVRQRRAFSNRLIQLRCSEERYRRSFVPTAIALYSTSSVCRNITAGHYIIFLYSYALPLSLYSYTYCILHCHFVYTSINIAYRANVNTGYRLRYIVTRFMNWRAHAPLRCQLHSIYVILLLIFVLHIIFLLLF